MLPVSLASDVLHFAVIGHPIAHSRSPVIHAAFARQLGLSIEYRRIDATPARLKDEVAAFFAAGGTGMNVTLPHKAAALGLCARIASRARQAGAVNTLSSTPSGVAGDNTDGVGLVRDLERIGAAAGRRLSYQHAVILGTGGAARGVIAGLLDAGVASLSVLGRDFDKTTALVHHFATHDLKPLASVSAAQRCDVLINATSAGLAKTSPAVGLDLASRAWLAYDLSYAPVPGEETPFLAECRLRGSERRSDGLGMLIEQAAESFYLWHGVRPDVVPVLDRLREHAQ